MGRLETQKRKSDEAIKQLNALAKRQSRQPHRKSYVSPYAKFDKIRRKRKWRIHSERDTEHASICSMLFTVSNTSGGGNASGVHIASTIPKKKLYLLLKDWNDEKEIPQSRVQDVIVGNDTVCRDYIHYGTSSNKHTWFKNLAQWWKRPRLTDRRNRGSASTTTPSIVKPQCIIQMAAGP